MIHNDLTTIAPMKNRLSFSLLSRWVFAPLLVGSLVAWGVSPAYSSNKQDAEASRATLKKAVNGPVNSASDGNSDVQEIKDRIKELEARERQNFAMVLDGQRKTMDWWFSFLAVLTALMAIFGALIPFLMARKDKEMIEHDKEQITKLLEAVKGMKSDAEDGVEKIHQLEADAKKVLEGFQSGKPSDESDSKISAAVATIERDKNADTPLRLRAEAIAASRAKDAAKAYALWNALIALAPGDASTQFNAGYWAQDLGESAQGAEKQHWLKLAGKHYAQALVINPDKQEAAYNWGKALSDEARAVSAQDLASARALWTQAEEKYRQALVINPDMHDATINWGTALADEARAVSSKDLRSARTLWKQAGEKFQQALGVKPDKHEAAYNWGTALADEASAVSAQDLGAARALWKQAGEKFRQALGVKPDKHQAAYNWGTALADEASAVSAQDLGAARALWKQAGEKFRQALDVKPDKHNAANMWGIVLADEAKALAASNAMESKILLDKAVQLLLTHADAAPGVVAYSLACVYGLRGDVQQCLHWLRISQSHKEIPDCAHLRNDKDLDAVRNSPEFVAWLATVCDEKESQDSKQDKPI